MWKKYYLWKDSRRVYGPRCSWRRLRVREIARSSHRKRPRERAGAGGGVGAGARAGTEPVACSGAKEGPGSGLRGWLILAFSLEALVLVWRAAPVVPAGGGGAPAISSEPDDEEFYGVRILPDTWELQFYHQREEIRKEIVEEAPE